MKIYEQDGEVEVLGFASLRAHHEVANAIPVHVHRHGLLPPVITRILGGRHVRDVGWREGPLAVVIERNVRKMGRAGLESITGSMSGGALKGMFGSAGRRWRERWQRDDDTP